MLGLLATRGEASVRDGVGLPPQPANEAPAWPPPGAVTIPAPDPIFPLPEPGKLAYLPATPALVPSVVDRPISSGPAAGASLMEAPAEPPAGIPSGRVVGVGQASWYGPGFHGRRTASGEVFDQNAMTAAHRTLPFGARVQVVNQRTGGSVVVRINDRGPHVRGRIIDLSRASARALGIGGAAPVRLVQ